MSWYILGAYFSPLLPILTGAKENTLLGLHCYPELLSTFPYQHTVKWNSTARKMYRILFSQPCRQRKLWQLTFLQTTDTFKTIRFCIISTFEQVTNHTDITRICVYVCMYVSMYDDFYSGRWRGGCRG